MTSFGVWVRGKLWWPADMVPLSSQSQTHRAGLHYPATQPQELRDAGYPATSAQPGGFTAVLHSWELSQVCGAQNSRAEPSCFPPRSFHQKRANESTSKPVAAPLHINRKCRLLITYFTQHCIHETLELFLKQEKVNALCCVHTATHTSSNLKLLSSTLHSVPAANHSVLFDNW